MNISIQEELKLLEQTALDFASRELVEARVERDRYPFAPLFTEVLEKVHEMGFTGITLPEELEGSAQGFTALAKVLVAICREDASLGGVIFTAAMAQEIMRHAKAKDLLQQILSTASGFAGSLIALASYCDPGETANVARARNANGEFLLSGQVEYVVLGNMVRNALLPATVEGESGYSFFFVDLEDPGVTRSEAILSLGLHACPAVDIELAAVPARLVGELGRGSAYFRKTADIMQVAAAAMSAGVMRGSFGEALAYSRQRRQGGREIVNWSEVRMLLAGMGVKLRTAELCLAEACRQLEAEEPGWEASTAATAICVQEAAISLTTDGIQLLGGNGYMKEYHQEKRFRDAQQLQALLGLAPAKRIKFIGRVIDGEPF